MSVETNIDLIEVLTGTQITRDARILDFGCGAGAGVYRLRDKGYRNAAGYDVHDYLQLRDEADRSHFRIAPRTSLRLPFGDDEFDIVISDQVFEHVKDQVTVFKELHRITKPGGCHLHVIPAPYYPIERHIFVPFGNLFPHRWWFKLWALAGIRNQFQKGLTADETADRNAFFAVQGLNYVSSSCYKVVWRTLGFDYRFAEQQFFDRHRRRLVRAIGRVNRLAPIPEWLYRTLKNRHVFLMKPAQAQQVAESDPPHFQNDTPPQAASAK